MTTVADLQAAAGASADRPGSAGQPLQNLLAGLATPDATLDQLQRLTGAALVELLRLCHQKGWDSASLVGAALDRIDAAPPPHQPLPTSRARKVAVYTGSFDPPTRFHRTIAERLHAEGIDEVIIHPDARRSDRPEHAVPIHRAAMTDLGFRELPWVSVELDDLDDHAFRTHKTLERDYSSRGEIWHIVSDDFVLLGRDGHSTIQTRWESGRTMWTNSRFVVFHPTGVAPDPKDLPPTSRLLPIDGYLPTADLRTMIYSGGADAAEGLVAPLVAEYIRRHGLFASEVAPPQCRITLDRPRLKIVTGPQEDATRRAARFRHLEHDNPNLILVIGGDGTMLRAIREYWRYRLPFLGLNAGHLGHLVNENLPDDLSGAELVLYRMPMLRVDTVGEDGKATRGRLAFNDAWVERDGGQGAWFRLEVNGVQRVEKVVADGLLVATPSGSAAYARAMGATPVPLNSPVISLAGSNVFVPPFWKPLALPDHTTVRMTSIGEPGKRPVRGFADGEPLGRIKAMEVRVSPVASVELAFTPKFDLSAKLLRSLFPPDDEGKNDRDPDDRSAEPSAEVQVRG